MFRVVQISIGQGVLSARVWISHKKSRRGVLLDVSTCLANRFQSQRFESWQSFGGITSHTHLSRYLRSVDGNTDPSWSAWQMALETLFSIANTNQRDGTDYIRARQFSFRDVRSWESRVGLKGSVPRVAITLRTGLRTGIHGILRTH